MIDKETALKLFAQAGALREHGDLAGAIALYSTLIAGFPVGWAYSDRGLTYLASGEKDKALDDFTSAVRQDPSVPAFYVNRGNALLGLDRFDEAIAEYSEAIQRDVSCKEAYNSRGYCYWKCGESDDGIADLERALSLDPRYVSAMFNLAIIMHDHRELKRSRELLEAADQVAPGDPQVQQFLQAVLRLASSDPS